ncbi:UNVERIFIED_ORG: integrase-like protein [Citrobacter freundii]
MFYGVICSTISARVGRDAAGRCYGCGSFYHDAMGKPVGAMFYSDQSSRYTSRPFRQLLWRCRIRQSISRCGNGWDNSPMKCFFQSLKNEWVPATSYINFSEAAHAITDYIVGYYSSLRAHDYNGGLPPNESESRYRKNSKAVVSFS